MRVLGNPRGWTPEKKIALKGDALRESSLEIFFNFPSSF